jgi:PAS domain S-box-containing protein
MIDAESRLAVPNGAASVHELLQFERLMSELSARFINLPASEIDAVIEGGLRRIVETLDIDRSSLTRLLPGTGQLQTTHSWAVDGLPPVLGAVWPADDFAYLVALGRAGTPLVFSSLSELPPVANAAKLAYQRFGMKSHVAQPLVVAGELVGFLGFGSLRRERTWPEDLLARMRLLAQIFAAALARKRAQEQLQEGEARLDAIVRSAMDAIITVDGDQRVVLFNTAAEKMFGCSASQANGAPLDRFIPERFRIAHRAHIERFVRTGETSRQVGTAAAIRALRADGTEFPVEASISRATIAGERLLTVILRDTTERMTAARQIEQALGFERLLADLSASMLRAPSLDVGRAISEVLRAIGEFLDVGNVALWGLSPKDEHFRLMLWWSAEGVRAPPVTVYKRDLPWFSDRLLRGEVVRFANLEELPADAAEDRNATRRFGTRSLLAVPLWVEGEVAAVLSLAVLGGERSWPDALIPRVKLIGEAVANLLERDRRAKQLAEAQGEAAHFRERLAHLVRVHTVGEMSAALAHEITQPLGAIENYALAARRRASEASPDVAKVVDLLDKVVGQATRAGDVVMRLRGLVKRHELQLTELDVEHAVRTCIEMVKADCELREIRVELKAADRVPRVVADEIHVQQVTLNLLRNAMEAMESLGSDRTKVITVEVGLPGPDAVMVQVADGGPGIPEGELERVFESFYSTKAEGLGIGLAICRKLIEAHGGALWASHNPGGGAVFQFTLPVRAAGS